MRPSLVPLLLVAGLLLLAACGGPDPIQTVRQFHIAAITQDNKRQEKLMDTSGVITPATDFQLMRDLLVYYAKTYNPTEPGNATKLVDATCNFSLDKDYTGEGVQVKAVADLSRVLTPFLGDAARGVVGKPKDIIRYTFTLEKQSGKWQITRVELPMSQLATIGKRYEIDLSQLNAAPVEESPEAPAE